MALLACELVPFAAAIERGVDMIMTAHILYPQLETDRIYSEKTGREEALPATLSDEILTGLLKGKMGYEGVVVTDAMNMAGISDVWDPVQSAVMAVSAGADMLLMPYTLHSFRELEIIDAIASGIEAAVTAGEIPQSRIDDAVLRILTLKERRGILAYRAQELTAEAALDAVGSEENRAAEREIAAAAVTVVRNENNTLPLRLTQESHVLMMVPYANEAAQMVMGFNRAREAGLVPEGAQVRTVRFDHASTLETWRAETDWADVIMINSEIPGTAHMNGGSWLSAYPLAVLGEAKAKGKTAVVISVDKPYDVQSYPQADAVLAVYGCKGSTLDPTLALSGGVTQSGDACGPNIIAGVEVALGVFGAGGVLPVDIPRCVEGAFADEIVYERGFSLTYPALTAGE